MSIVNPQVIETLKHQHRIVIDMTTKILNSVNKESQNIDDISISLRILAGKVREHVGLEDREIYPRLMISGDSTISSLAIKYKNDIGGLLPKFNFYMENWLNKTKIQNNLTDFTKDTNEILNALLLRIETEDKELYPLIDGLSEK
ncbi:MAG: hemerythrin domain-containing protein [Blastocatellia bacterium]